MCNEYTKSFIVNEDWHLLHIGFDAGLKISIQRHTSTAGTDSGQGCASGGCKLEGWRGIAAGRSILEPRVPCPSKAWAVR